MASGPCLADYGNEEDVNACQSQIAARDTRNASGRKDEHEHEYEQRRTDHIVREQRRPRLCRFIQLYQKLGKELKVSVDISEQVILSFYSLAMLSEAMGENASFLGDCETKGAQMLLKSNQAGGLGKAFKKTGEAMKAMKEPMERRSRDLSKKFSTTAGGRNA